jgi:hypothetical protein
MIKTDITICNNDLIENKFAYHMFKEKTYRGGNIIAFVSKVEIINKTSKLYADEAINFLWEIPDITPMAAVCVQRLFSSIVGNILSNTKFLNTKVEIDEEKIIIHKEHNQGDIIQPHGQASLNDLNFVNTTGIGYLGIYTQAGSQAPAFAYSTKMTDDTISGHPNCTRRSEFMVDCIKEFYGMMQSVFISTSRI